MKKLAVIFAILPLAVRALDWWERPTICRPSNNECYAGQGGASFLTDGDEAWDNGASCRGKKRVCDNAIIGGTGTNYLSKAEISDPSIISSDFDIGALNAGCWGVRKTRNSATSASVNGNWVSVWCSGALSDQGEAGAGGFISAASEPNCADLRDRGFIGVLAGACYGRGGFDAQRYYLECRDGAVLPARIAVLNGAGGYNAGGTGTPGTSATQDGADEIFEKMIVNAAAKRDEIAKGE